MGFRWLSFVCALALFVQASLSYPKEEPEDTLRDESAREEEIKIREKRQSGCKDLNNYCSQWPDSYCEQYKVYMERNCPKKCGYCSGPTAPPVCNDKSKHCSGWMGSGYCDKSSKWHNYMKGNCAKTCGFCGGGGSGGTCNVSDASTLVKACTFDQDTCDWHNIPFDDQGDFKLRSGSSVRGPSSGSGGSGGYLLASEKAQLLIPFELVLANHDSDYSQMCIRFNYFMKRGKLILYEIQNIKGSPKKEKIILSGDKGSQWNCEKVTVEVSVKRQLMFEAVPDDTGYPIGLDDISFTRNC